MIANKISINSRKVKKPQMNIHIQVEMFFGIAENFDILKQNKIQNN